MAIIPRRVLYLPWWPCQLHCGHRQRVYQWRGLVRCLCQLSNSERQQLAHDIRLDKEDYSHGDHTQR